MKYIVAFDGGGTKTRINVVDLEGNIVFDKITRGCNIFSIGEEPFKEVIKECFDEAKEFLKITNEDIESVYLGLSGADLEEDYIRLENACKPLFGDLKYTIVNDAWIILRSGVTSHYGAVCIAGTGTNSAAVNQNGDQAILRALNYTLGTYGGGIEIAREGLHQAFRADELTYEDTMLREEIPKLLKVKNMEEVVPFFYPKRTIDKQTYGSITPLVNECALKGDAVSIMILEKVATHMALQTVGVMKQVGVIKEEIPVVYGGRVFTLTYKGFLETFKNKVLEYVPNATFVEPKFTPVIGAYLNALDELGIKQTKQIESNLLRSGGQL